MSVLITGGAGFIGSHTAVEFLNAGSEYVIDPQEYVTDENETEMEFLGVVEEGSEEEKTALKKSKIKWLVFNVIAFISNGLSCVIQNAEQRVMEGEGVFSMTALSFSFAAVCALIVYLIYVAATKGETIKADFCALAHNKKSIAFNAVGLGIVNLGVTFLATKVPAAFLYPVALGGSVIIATIFSAVFTKEKMTWRVILGVVLGVAAIVIFSL